LLISGIEFQAMYCTVFNPSIEVPLIHVMALSRPSWYQQNIMIPQYIYLPKKHTCCVYIFKTW